MSKPAELLLFDFFTEQIEASQLDDVIYSLELHDTVYQKIQTDRGVRISDSVSEMVPTHDGGIKEYNVSIQLVCYSRVLGKEKAEARTGDDGRLEN